MTEAQRAERGRRAQLAWDEFIAPVLTEVRTVYSARIVDNAVTELSRDKRTDKLTALSTALRILDQVEAGLHAVIVDGEMADKSRLRAQEVERLSPARRRLLNMAL